MAGWKAAKGLYIIPILVATSPIVPATWEGNSVLAIFLAISTATIAMIVFSVVLERYYFRKLNILETSLFAVCCVLLMLPHQFADYIGIAMFIALTFIVYGTRSKPAVIPGYETNTETTLEKS